MGLFTKKPKKTKEELEAERAERIEATSTRLKTQLLKTQKLKNTYVQKAVEADKKGLIEQRETAKNQLRKCMKLEKQINGMIMSMELAVETKELNSLSSSFMQCMGEMSQDIIANNSKINVKKTQDQYLKAMYAQKQQEQKLDQILDIGDYGMINTQDYNSTSEFDSEIDALMSQASTESGNYNASFNKTKDRR